MDTTKQSNLQYKDHSKRESGLSGHKTQYSGMESVKHNHPDVETSPTQPIQHQHYPPFEEQKYIDLVKKILTLEKPRQDRTGTGTLSTFGEMLTFDLSQGKIPLLTTKKIFWKAIVEELLFFIKGETNSKKLTKKGIKIWEGNSTREYLDSIGLKERPEGDLGPVYSHQWRHFGAEYKGCDVDYTGKGVDQLQNAVDTIKNDPNSRRIVVSAWNPMQLKEMALPPCHLLFQFYVKENELQCMLTMRSSDVGLGLPFNIASYALLTHLIAHVCNLKATKLIVSLGDTHVYLNHVEALKEQCTRKILNDFPKVVFKESIGNLDDIESYKIELVGYMPQSAIKMEMSK